MLLLLLFLLLLPTSVFPETMEKTFYAAAEDGRVEEVKDILRKNPSLNVNWKNEEEDACTALYAACSAAARSSGHG